MNAEPVTDLEEEEQLELEQERKPRAATVELD